MELALLTCRPADDLPENDALMSRPGAILHQP
jgi:hypothetical protein